MQFGSVTLCEYLLVTLEIRRSDPIKYTGFKELMSLSPRYSPTVTTIRQELKSGLDDDNDAALKIDSSKSGSGPAGVKILYSIALERYIITNQLEIEKLAKIFKNFPADVDQKSENLNEGIIVKSLQSDGTILPKTEDVIDLIYNVNISRSHNDYFGDGSNHNEQFGAIGESKIKPSFQKKRKPRSMLVTYGQSLVFIGLVIYAFISTLDALQSIKKSLDQLVLLSKNVTCVNNFLYQTEDIRNVLTDKRYMSFYDSRFGNSSQIPSTDWRRNPKVKIQRLAKLARESLTCTMINYLSNRKLNDVKYNSTIEANGNCQG